MSILLSVITPTYNRIHTLHRVRDSLERQGAANFEWIVVDDGSTDGTGRLIESWQSDSTFPIRYTAMPRSGRNAAMNVAKTKTSGRFITLMDSDDAYLENAMSKIAENIEKYLIPDSAVQGIAFPYSDERGNRLCTPFPSESFRSAHLDARFAHRIRGEFLIVYKREAYEDVRHIELPLPNHLPPSLAHVRLNHTFVYIDDVIGWKYRHDGESRITKQPSDDAGVVTDRQSAMVKYIRSVESLNYSVDYFLYNPMLFCRNAINSVALGLFFGIGPIEQYRSIGPWKAKILCLLMLPIGLIKLAMLSGRYGRADRKWHPRSAKNF